MFDWNIRWYSKIMVEYVTFFTFKINKNHKINIHWNIPVKIFYVYGNKKTFK